MNVTQWHGCYSDSWQGVITPDAFAHPAKYARGLIRRIYQHMLDSGYVARGDSIIDPFGGVALGGLDAMTFGLHWTGCELEPRFVELGQRNIDKWRRDLAMLNGTLGTARLLQGDSRRLLEVVGAGMAAAVSSPPFSGDKNLMAVNDQGVRSDMVARRGMVESDTQQSPGNLAALRADDAGFTAAVSSPPYADNAATWVEGPGARHDPVHHNGDNAHKISSANGYGATPGQLGALPGDGFQAAVSSPPYSGDALGHDAGTVRLDKKEDDRRATEGAFRRPGYGSTPGNVGNMRDGGFEGVVSSPPFESTVNHDGGKADYLEAKNLYSNYGEHPANIGNDTGDTFWTAARVIVEQTYAALRPGGYAAWVTKRFVRDKQIVEFSEQWAQLCEVVGFTRVEWIRAMLVERHGHQLDIFGGTHPKGIKRASFFRRLYESKYPQNAIDWEDVIIMRKSNA